MDEIPGAKFKHALRGLILGLAASGGEEADAYEIKITDKKPYFKVRAEKLGEGIDKVYDDPKWVGYLIEKSRGNPEKSPMEIPFFRVFGE